LLGGINNGLYLISLSGFLVVAVLALILKWAFSSNKSLIEKVLKLIDQAEYKRRQYPPGTKISSKAFGRDRRQPITNNWRESL
jgi:anti-sigma factor ChrR (cupin superfamily)